MGKALGSAERIVLVKLSEWGGVWRTGNRPLWESAHWTLTLLNTLTSKGLVKELESNTRYELSELGHAKVKEIVTQAQDVSSGPWNVGWPSQRGNQRAEAPNHHWR